MTKYYLKWYDDRGNSLTRPDMVHMLDYVRSENTVGVANIIVPRGDFKYEDFRVDQIVEIWRSKFNTDALQNETAYFLRDWEFYTDMEGKELIQLYLYDANYILDGTIVAYAAASAQAAKTDYADDMLKEIVTENLASTTDSDRNKITVAGDLSLAASITKAFAWRNVLRTCQEIAQKSNEDGTYLAFDVVRTSVATFEFRTYTGQRGINHGRDSSDIRLVGKQYGNLIGERFGTYHRDEANYVYVGGEGREAAREIVERSDTGRIGASAWNRREMFWDGRNTTATAGLQAEGDAALDANKPKQVMTGQLQDTPGMRYGIEYGFGDIVSVEAFGFAVDCHVSTVRGTFDTNNGEKIDVRLRGEL